MAGQYSTKSFFRQMPNALLARYFKEKRDSRRRIEKVRFRQAPQIIPVAYPKHESPD